MLAKIIINRKSEWLNRMRDFKIFVDDKEAGRVKNGSAEEIVVEEGVHIIYLKYGFYKSEPLTITLNKSENKFLLARNGMKYVWVLYILLFGCFVPRIIDKNSGGNQPNWLPYFMVICILPSLLYFLYYAIFARNKYLVLEIDHRNIFNT